MHWEFSTNRIATVTLPMYIIGTDYDATLSLVTGAGEELNGAYLFVSRPELVGSIQAKRASESVYRIVQGPFDAGCFLGYIPADAETEIDIRIQIPESAADGYRVITLLIGHDDYALRANPYFHAVWPELWHDEWAELWT